MVSTKLFLTVFKIVNKKIIEQHISTVEGPCETEDWSDDADNSALHHRNKLQF